MRSPQPSSAGFSSGSAAAPSPRRLVYWVGLLGLGVCVGLLFSSAVEFTLHTAGGRAALDPGAQRPWQDDGGPGSFWGGASDPSLRLTRSVGTSTTTTTTTDGSGVATCPQPSVDWSKYAPAPQETRGGSAAIFTRDYHDPALPWLVLALQSLGYEVSLYAVHNDVVHANAFLRKGRDDSPADLAGVRVQRVAQHGAMLAAPTCKVFVHVAPDAWPHVAGRGAVNLYVMTPPGGGGGQGAAARLRQQLHLAGAGKPPAGADATGNSTPASEQQQQERAVLLAGYDYALCRDGAACNGHLQALTPVFERMQLAGDLMFPLVDVLPLPPADRASFEGKVFQVAHRAVLCKPMRFFMRETLWAYKARLTPAAHRARDAEGRAKLQAAAARHRSSTSSGGATSGSSRYAAVIVEARPHYAFLYAVLNAAWYLPGWALHVVHTRLNAGFVRRVLEPYVGVQLHQLDTDNVDIDHYNLLMKNGSFWQMFDADHVLLFQTDSLILRAGLERFATFDYIGAPWHMENERWSKPMIKAALPEGVGNGGFSLRSTRSMVDICHRYSASSPLKEQEDVFFAMHVRENALYRLGDRQSAYEFCLEVPCGDMRPVAHPYALHAAHYYNPLPVLQALFDFSLVGLLDCHAPH